MTTDHPVSRWGEKPGGRGCASRGGGGAAAERQTAEALLNCAAGTGRSSGEQRDDGEARFLSIYRAPTKWENPPTVGSISERMVSRTGDARVGLKSECGLAFFTLFGFQWSILMVQAVWAIALQFYLLVHFAQYFL